MTPDHTTQLEEVMAYLDGQLASDAAERARLHLEACAECRQFAGDVRQVSGRLAAWNVGAAPESLQAHRAAPFLPRSAMAAAAAIVIVIIGGVWMTDTRRSRAPAPPAEAKAMVVEASRAERSEAAPAQTATQVARPPVRVGGNLAGAAGQAPAAVPDGPLVVRTARISIVPRDFDAARRELDRLIQDAGGFVGRIVTYGGRGNPRTLEATVRIPSAKLDATLVALRALGHVTGETAEGEDVTSQSVDLDSRLANARTSERRLRELLERRTGDLADVLAVERELARVRGEIEGMESQRKDLDGRVSYASVQVTFGEERKAEVTLGPVAFPTRIRNAFVDGWSQALGIVAGTLLFIVGIAPTLGVLALVAVPAWALVRRWRRRP